MISRRRCWLSMSMLLLLGAAIAAASNWEPLRRTLADLSRLVTDAPGMLCVLVAPPLFLLILFLWAGWEVNSGSAARWSGELDYLHQRHRQGLLRQAAQRIRSSTHHGSQSSLGQLSKHPIASGALPSAPVENLDRLVQKKRSGAWSSWSHKAGAPPSTEHGHAEI
jgi:hypothetical protein